MKKNNPIVILSILASIFLFISAILSIVLFFILIWMTLALKILIITCICCYIFSIVAIFILIILKCKNSQTKIFCFSLIIYLIVTSIMILELVIGIVNSNKYTDYYKNCPFYFGLFELNKCKNRRCLPIESNYYICSYDASNKIYSSNYCLYSKYDIESNQQLDAVKIGVNIICEKATYKYDHINVDLFFSECDNNTDIYYCYRKDNFKIYSNIGNHNCDNENVCDKNHKILGISEIVLIIICCLIQFIFVIFLCKIFRMEHRKKPAQNIVNVGTLNTTSARNLNRRRSRSRNRSRSRKNESNASTEGNKNQEDIKDFKIEKAKNILVENKEVFVLKSSITFSSDRMKERKGSENQKINNENNNK